MARQDVACIAVIFACFMGIAGATLTWNLDHRVVAICPLCPSDTSYIAMKYLAQASCGLPVALLLVAYVLWLKREKKA